MTHRPEYHFSLEHHFFKLRHLHLSHFYAPLYLSYYLSKPYSLHLTIAHSLVQILLGSAVSCFTSSLLGSKINFLFDNSICVLNLSIESGGGVFYAILSAILNRSRRSLFPKITISPIWAIFDFIVFYFFVVANYFWTLLIFIF